MSVLWTVLTIAGYIVAGLGAIVALILVALAIDTVFARQDDCRVDLYRVTHRRGGSITHRRTILYLLTFPQHFVSVGERF